MTPQPCSNPCPFSPEQFNELCVNVATLAANYTGMKEQQDKIYKSIEGNGRPGLRERLDKVEIQLIEHESQGLGAEKAEQKSEAKTQRNWLSISSLIASCGTLIAIAYHIHHMAK